MPDVTAVTRRVVTGTAASGDPMIVSDGRPPRSGVHTAIPGMVNTVVWHTSAAMDAAPGDPTSALTSFVPGAGETVALIVTFPPDAVYGDDGFDPAAAATEQRELIPGLAELFEPDNPGVHTTPTIDYAVVLSGEIVLDLGSDSTTLRHGDVVVQNGTRHAWRNQTDHPATIFVVLVGT